MESYGGAYVDTEVLAVSVVVMVMEGALVVVAAVMLVVKAVRWCRRRGWWGDGRSGNLTGHGMWR